jgi:hypothetical protein
LVATSDE